MFSVVVSTETFPQAGTNCVIQGSRPKRHCLFVNCSETKKNQIQNQKNNQTLDKEICGKKEGSTA